MQSFHFAPREGRLWKVLLGVCAVAGLAGSLVAYPQYAYASLMFILIGLVGTWREYGRWRGNGQGLR